MSTESRITLTAEEAAEMLGCEPETVEERARLGELPGVKFGRKWVFPVEALAFRLNAIALEESARRLKKPAPSAVQVQQTEGRRPPKLDLLRDKPRRQVLTPQ